MDLRGKKLLMLGGASYTRQLRQYADAAGFRLYAAGNTVNLQMAAYVEEFFLAEARDVEAICALVKAQHIDGIVALGNEDIIDRVITVAERCGIPFYVSRANWQQMQDKHNFKAHCREFGVDVVEEYALRADADDETLRALPFPVVFKPSDSCASRGITICDKAEDIRAAIEKACSFSRSDTFLVERYMRAPEFIVTYMLDGGKARVWMLGDRHMNTQQKGLGGLSNLSVFPSRYAELYWEKVHGPMEALLKAHGPVDGTMFVQGFVDGDTIRFFDPGLRFCGTLDTILYGPICGVNPLHWMANHALTGVMDDAGEMERMDWQLHGKTAAQLSILIEPGTVARITGLDEVRRLPGVIDVVQLLDEGDTVTMAGTLQQVLARVYFITDERSAVLQMVERIYETVAVLNDQGRDMKMPFVLDYPI